MARTADEYKRLLQSLLPKGALWNRIEDSIMTKLLYALADEFSRAEERHEDLIRESIPTLCDELIEDYEIDLLKKARIIAYFVCVPP